MRLTLTALASQYIHMPLAPFCLKKAVDESLPQVETTICDLNINDTQEELLARLMATEPDVVGVCLYIWNRACAASLIRRVKALRPEVTVIVGGPEATFSVQETLADMPADYLLRGAGEESLPALLRCLLTGDAPADVPGLCTRTADGLRLSAPAPAPAPRADLYDGDWQLALKGRMAYVETSRGCPFSCAFCLSGSECSRTVQFMPQEEALGLLIRLGQSGAETIKLIDRTFNCHRARTKFLLAGLIGAKQRGEIGDVCYHFEVAADLFDGPVRLVRRAAVQSVQGGQTQGDLRGQALAVGVHRGVARQPLQDRTRQAGQSADRLAGEAQGQGQVRFSGGAHTAQPRGSLRAAGRGAAS